MQHAVSLEREKMLQCNMCAKHINISQLHIFTMYLVVLCDTPHFHCRCLSICLSVCPDGFQMITQIISKDFFSDFRHLFSTFLYLDTLLQKEMNHFRPHQINFNFYRVLMNIYLLPHIMASYQFIFQQMTYFIVLVSHSRKQQK